MGKKILSTVTGDSDEEISKKINNNTAGNWWFDILRESEQRADGVGDYLKERYGTWDGFSKASYEDPVGVFSDFMSLLGG